MSARFTRRARYLTFAGLATLGLAAVVQVAVTPAATSGETYTVGLHQDPPIQNSTFEDDENDCPGSPDQWGWHFVLTGGDASFVKLTTTFEDAGTIVTTTFGPPSAKHAYVYTETDDTLTGATAEFTLDDPEADPADVMLVLSHTCTGDTVVGTPSATPSETVSPTATVSETPSETPSETVSETPSETPSATVSATVSETPSETPSETVSETPSETPSATVSGTVIETPSETPAETESPIPSASVSGVVLTKGPSGTPSVTASVQGVRQTRGPRALPTTGSTLPVGLLLLLGFGLVGGGVLMTVTGEPAAATTGGKHRR